MKKILTLCAALLLFGQSRISADPVAANSFPRPPEEEPLLAPEVMPSFRGDDMDKFMFWLNYFLVYPKKAEENNINGKVIVSFIIEKDGRLTNTEILSSTDRLFDKEVVRVLKECPQWNPGTENGEPVRTKLVIPVTFQLPDELQISECERLPAFMGRHPREFVKWVGDRVIYPEETLKLKMKGEVKVGFTIDEAGNLTDIEILNKCDRVFSNEVVRVMKLSPKWEPASKDGENCRVKLSTSFVFAPGQTVTCFPR